MGSVIPLWKDGDIISGMQVKDAASSDSQQRATAGSDNQQSLAVHTAPAKAAITIQICLKTP